MCLIRVLMIMRIEYINLSVQMHHTREIFQQSQQGCIVMTGACPSGQKVAGYDIIERWSRRYEPIFPLFWPANLPKTIDASIHQSS